MINKTFIINLLHDNDRKNDMIKKLKEINITSFEFVNAINGHTDLSKCDFKVINNWYNYMLKRTITVGEIGCALSHYNIWKYIVDNNIDRALILEDDVLFLNDFNKMLKIIEQLKMKYDIFYLSRNPLNKYFKNMDEIEINDYVLECKSSYNAHSYIITYECANILINSNFINNLLPVDDFLCILYDRQFYPYKEYIKYFEKCKTIKAYSLKYDITDQDTYKYGSSVNNSDLYIKYIKDIDNDNSNNIKMNIADIWTIDINNFYSQNHIRFIEEMDTFLKFHYDINVNYMLNINNNRFNFVEKLIYDNAMFHIKRLNINVNNKCISFWSKLHEYDFDYMHMHIDHCDYESRVYKYERKRPIFTSIIYFNDNDCPTLITDITEDMYKTNNFSNNNKLILSFPKILKNIVFESGKYYHGESYISDYNITIRKTIVIAVWEESNKPLYIPNFDVNFFYYHAFMNHDRLINEESYNEFDKDTIVFNYKRRDDKIITIKLNDNNIINYEFFYKLIKEKNKKQLYEISDIIYRNTKNPDTIIIDFSDLLIKPNYHNMKCYIEDYNLTIKLNTMLENQLFNETLLLDGEYSLDINKESLTILEKYVYDISIFHINSLGISMHDLNISFKIINNKTNSEFKIQCNNNNVPYMSCITFLEETPNQMIITDIDIESYIYKNFENKKLCLIYPKKFMHIAFSGNSYIKTSSCMSIMINYWKKTNIINIEHYNKKYDNSYKKYEPYFVLKKQLIIPKQEYIKKKNLLESLLYKNEDINILNIYSIKPSQLGRVIINRGDNDISNYNPNILKDSLKNEDNENKNIIILNVLNEDAIKSNKETLNNGRLNKLKFII